MWLTKCERDLELALIVMRTTRRKITKIYRALCIRHFLQPPLFKCNPITPCFCCTSSLLLLRILRFLSVGHFGNLLALPYAVRKCEEVNTQEGNLWPGGNNKFSSLPERQIPYHITYLRSPKYGTN